MEKEKQSSGQCMKKDEGTEKKRNADVKARVYTSGSALVTCMQGCMKKTETPL